KIAVHLAARVLLLCYVHGQVRHTAKIEEYAFLNIRESKEYMPAKRTSCNEAGTLRIQMRLGKATLCAAIRTLSFCAGNVHREYSAQFTCGSISVKIVHRCTHFRSPVAPKRSVLIFLRSWPAAISRSVALSTNDVGPQT